MDEDTGPGYESGWESELLLNALQEEEQEFRSSEAEIEARVAEQFANITKDLK